MRKIYKAYSVYQKNNLTGIKFLRDAHDWFNFRHEANNEGKGPLKLLQDFSEFVIALDKENKSYQKFGNIN